MLLMRNTPFSPDQNPFQFMINGQNPRGGTPPMPSPTPDGSPLQALAAMQGGSPPQGGMPPQMPDAMQPGKTGDSTKPLLMAISALHSYLAAISDPQEIDLVRKVVSLLTNLIQKDQQRSSAMMQQQMQQGPQSQQPQGPQQQGGGANG